MSSDSKLEEEDNSSPSELVREESPCPDIKSPEGKFIEWGMEGFEDDSPPYTSTDVGEESSYVDNQLLNAST